jgi:hypothetical protein
MRKGGDRRRRGSPVRRRSHRNFLKVIFKNFGIFSKNSGGTAVSLETRRRVHSNTYAARNWHMKQHKESTNNQLNLVNCVPGRALPEAVRRDGKESKGRIRRRWRRRTATATGRTTTKQFGLDNLQRQKFTSAILGINVLTAFMEMVFYPRVYTLKNC